MTEMLQPMLPPPTLWTRKVPAGVVMAPPEATAPIRMGEASTRSLGTEVTGAAQSPKSWQSLCVATAAKRGTGAVAEAVVTEETGARAMVSCATAGGVERGREMNVGNCAVSSTEGLANPRGSPTRLTP